MADKPANLFVDLSSNNPVPSRRRLRRHYKAGRRLLVLKVSQGTGYTWSDSHQLSEWWHQLGGVVGHYHWTSPGGAAYGTQQADYFWDHVQHDLADGDLLIEDLEQQGATEAEHAAFQARLTLLVRRSKLKLTRWTYSGVYFLESIHAKPHGTKFWGAGYPTLPPTPPGWTLVAHQYTDKASAPGLAGSLDQSRLLAPLPHPPAPKPTKPKPLKFGPIRTRVFTRITAQLNAGHKPDAHAVKVAEALAVAWQKATK